MWYADMHTEKVRCHDFAEEILGFPACYCFVSLLLLIQTCVVSVIKFTGSYL